MVVSSAASVAETEVAIAAVSRAKKCMLNDNAHGAGKIVF